MGTRRIWPTGWRAIVLLMVGAVMGANLVTPAVAHISSSVDHLWKEHIRPKSDKRYQRIPTSAQHLTIPGSAFADADGLNRGDTIPSNAAGESQWCTSTGGDRGYAAMHQPQGVTMTKVTANFGDDSGTTGGNGIVWTTRMPLVGAGATGGTYSDIFTISLPDAAPAGTLASAFDDTASSAAGAKVDNTRHVYNVIFDPGTGTSICGIDITYSVPKPFAATALKVDAKGATLPSSRE